MDNIIYRFQPFATDKQLGREYNAHCSIVPNDTDWIMIMDWDTSILDISSYNVIEQAIKRYPETEIFGAYTNRVGYNWHMDREWEGKPFKLCDNFNLAYHKKLAQGYATKYRDGESVSIPTVAGFFMLFRKKYWINNKFQEQIISENGRCFDKEFCKNAKDMKIIKGLYVFHQYRMDKDYHDRSHLKNII